MTNDECRREALRRLAEADRIFNNRTVICAEQHRKIDEVYQIAAHLRQTAAAYAALSATPKDDTEGVSE